MYKLSKLRKIPFYYFANALCKKHQPIQVTIVSMTLVLLLCTSFNAVAEQLDLPRDSYGWTKFSPSHNSRIVYVSNSGSDSTGTVYSPASPEIGNNSFEPINILPFRTYSAAYANTREGYPDWILLKRGDTFDEPISNQIRSGRSATEPFLIASYGASGAIPTMRTGSTNAVRIWNDGDWIAISGIDFYAHTRDFDAASFVDTTGDSGFFIRAATGETVQGILIEGCKFRFYTTNISFIVADQGTLSGVTVRRNTILDSYTDGDVGQGHSQGFWSDDTDDLIVEENIFDHNGWYRHRDADTYGSHDDADGQATVFNHNTYMTNLTNATFESNIFLRPSSMHNKFTSSTSAGPITVKNNLYFDGEVVIGAGTNYSGLYRFNNMTIRDNVAMNIGRSRPTDRVLGWGFQIAGWDGGIIDGNYILHQNDPAVVNALGMEFRDVMRKISVTNNTIYGTQYSRSIRIDSSNSGSTDQIFSNNIIQIPTNAKQTFYCEYDISGEWDLSDNTYYSDMPEGSRYMNDYKDLTLEQWNAATGDNSSFEQVNLPQGTRTIEAYQEAIGEIATIDAFIEKARKMSRYSWNEDYTAARFNNWIRTGQLPLVSAPRNFRIKQ